MCARFEIRRQQILQRTAALLVGDGAGDEGRRRQDQQQNLLRHERFGEPLADHFRRRGAHDERSGAGDNATVQALMFVADVAKKAVHDEEDEPAGVDPAEDVQPTAATAEQPFLLQDGANHRPRPRGFAFAFLAERGTDSSDTQATVRRSGSQQALASEKPVTNPLQKWDSA